jgi:DNA invertase Pin-like site-specific DNA recombinase
MPVTPKSTPKTPFTGRAFVAYYRVSTARQGESGLGLDAQRAAVAKYLASVVDAKVVAEFTEVESGKRHTNRPELAAAIARAKKAGATLVIAKLDRLARNVHFISGLMEAAADFVACDMPHANRLTIHILAALAEHEREMISARTVAALEQVKARGTKLGNPRWAESIEAARAARKKAARPVEVKSILAGYQSEGHSLRTIANRMNTLGLKTVAGGAWHPNSVRRALLALPQAA